MALEVQKWPYILEIAEMKITDIKESVKMYGIV